MRTRLVLAALALALATLGVAWLALRRGAEGPMPAFEVTPSECDARAAHPIAGLTRLVALETVGPGGTSVRLESNGRWERQVSHPPEQFAIPPDVTRGCVEPELVRPFFEDLAGQVALDAGGAPESDAAMLRETPEGLYAVGPCTQSYAAGDADAALPYQCSFPDLAARVFAAVQAAPRPAPPAAPAACSEARCSFALEVGHVPHPHESGSTRTYELYRDGTYRCARDGDALVGRVTNGERVFEWLVAGASSPAPEPPAETFDPVGMASVLDASGDAHEGIYPFEDALARWNAIAGAIDPACVAAAER